MSTLSERLRDAQQLRSECFDSDGIPSEVAFRDLGFNHSHLFKEAADELDRLTARVAELKRSRLGDINLAISHLGQIYGLIEEGLIDEASDYCRCAADSWTQDIADLESKHE